MRWRERAREVSTPSAWVVSLDPVLPRTGRALDVAGGAGRHARWMARRGLDVTMLDVSDEGLALARAGAAEDSIRLHLVEMDLETSALPAGPWDLVLCFHYLQRSLFPAIVSSLARGGLLAFCHQTVRNLERHPRPGPAYLLEEGEAPSLIADLEIVSYSEDWFEEGRHEARLVARRSWIDPRSAPGAGRGCAGR